MHPSTRVTLPDISAAQRQTLVSLLDRARSSAASDGLVDYSARLTDLAFALDLHRDAVPAEQAEADREAALGFQADREAHLASLDAEAVREAR